MSDTEEEKTPEAAEKPDSSADVEAVPIAAEIVAPAGPKSKKKIDKSVTTPVSAVAVEVEEGEGKGAEKITIKDEEDKKPAASPKKKEGKKKKKEKEKPPCCSCILVLNIVNIACLFLASLFYLCGSIFFHPDTIAKWEDLPDEPYAFFIVGSLLYTTFTIIELLKKRGHGIVQLIASILNLVGALLWFVSSCFVFSDTFDYLAFGGCWLTGSLLNLTAVTMYITALFMKGSKPFFEICSLATAWIGNLMFLAGAAMLISVYTDILTGATDDGIPTILLNDEGDVMFDQPGKPDFGGIEFDDDEVNFTSAIAAFWAEKCDVKDYAGIFISASILYLVYGAFYVLSIFKSDVTFSIHVGKAPELEEDDEEE